MSAVQTSASTPGELKEGRCVVLYEPDSTAALADLCEVSLAQYDEGLFVRGLTLVHIVDEPLVATSELPPNPKIRRVSPSTLAERVSRVVVFETSSGRRLKPVREVVEALHSRGEWPHLLRLSGIATGPFLRPDGSICARAGHDLATGIFLRPVGGPFPTVPDEPTRADAEDALNFLKFDILGEFQTADDVDRSVLLAAYLAPSLRTAFDVCPLFGFDAAAPGAGKTTAARGVSILADAGQGAVLSLPRNDDAELDKTLAAALVRGDHAVIFDNISHPLRSDALCAAVTSPVFSFRVLGYSETANVPNQALILVTGNNLQFVGDLAQRALVCRLDPRCEHPDRQRFKISDFVGHVRSHRPRILAAALTIARAYIAAGKPRMKAAPWSRFAGFDRLVRSPLLWLGEADPLDTVLRAWRADPEREDLLRLLDAIREADLNDPFEVATLMERAGDLGGVKLRAAVQAVAADGDRLSSRRLGKYLSKHAGRIVDDLQLMRHSSRRGIVRWQVVKAPSDASQTHQTHQTNAEVLV